MSTTAHSLLQPSAAVVNCTNEQVDLEDAADRAERHRKHAQQRVNLRQVGFWPKNRGGVGVSSTHIHEVCSDIRTNKIRRQRYEPLQLLAVPEGPMLEKFKAANKSKCTSDPLMPAFSEEMKYVAATKTHFVHACKLFCEGSHHFYNKPQNPKIRFKAGDKEAAEIQSEGILAVIYAETIWNDMGAVEALCAIGNFNAQIDQSEDEMQAFGRINELVNRLPGVALKDDDIVLKALQDSSGLGHFTPEQWKHLLLRWMKMQVQVEGSYRSEDMVEVLNWMLPVAHSPDENMAWRFSTRRLPGDSSRNFCCPLSGSHALLIGMAEMTKESDAYYV